MTTRAAFLCDFDGTVSPADIGAALIRRFAPDAEPERVTLLERWASGALGHRELTEAECAPVRVTEAEARAFARGFALDPHFPGFVAAAHSRGDVVMVVSEGFDFYVADHLERLGLAGLPWAANHARFADGRLIPEFPWRLRGCGRCGNCKAQHADSWRARGYRVVTVGDGLSDRCGAEASDQGLARGSLLDWCRARRMPAVAFHDFADVEAWARTGLAAAREA